MKTTFHPSLYGVPSLGRSVCIYMQRPPIYVMGANISIATNMQWLSLHVMTGRATRVRASVVRYCYTKEVCVHKGKPLSSQLYIAAEQCTSGLTYRRQARCSSTHAQLKLNSQLPFLSNSNSAACMQTARWFVRLWVSCVVKLRQLTRFGEKFQLWLPNVWWLTTSNQHHENASITVVVALLHCIACIHSHHFVES